MTEKPYDDDLVLDLIADMVIRAEAERSPDFMTRLRAQCFGFRTVTFSPDDSDEPSRPATPEELELYRRGGTF